MNDEVFRRSVRIERAASDVFAWHERPGALARLCPPWERIELISAEGGIRDGARVAVRVKIGWKWTDFEVEHRDFVENERFCDVQIRGPFAAWRHVHRFERAGEQACVLTDEITYRLPGGAAGQALGCGVARRKLERMFAWRHAVTKADLERAISGVKRVLIAGASGLIGSALAVYLTTQGHDVRRLVRRRAQANDEIEWAPETGRLDARALEGVDAIVNLSGENVGAGRWTATRRERILRSRLDATRTLVDAVSRMRRKVEVLVNASAIGVYGDRGDEVLGEEQPPGPGFLADVCRAWEEEARVAERQNVRVVVTRFGVVLTPAGGALAKMLPIFRAGVGGRLGNGCQWMSWIGIDDLVEIVARAITDARWSGVYNLIAPQPLTNAEFTRTLARVLRRPALLPAPAWAVRAALGQMADEALLSSARAMPKRVEEAGYAFRHSELEPALRHVLGR